MNDYLLELSELSSWLLLAAAILYILAISESPRARLYFYGGMAAHVANFIKRGVDLGWVPLAEKHDTISFMAFSTAVVMLLAYRRRRDDRLFLFGAPVVTALLFVSFLTRRIDGLSPFMKTPWFFLHTGLYFFSIGFFAVGAILAALYVADGEPRYETLQYRTILTGWITYTTAMVAGSIWFFIAYGTYWLWTSREMWSTLTWFYIGLYLHARLTPGFRGKPAAVLGGLGFAVALFSYFGVGTIIPSPPTPF